MLRAVATLVLVCLPTLAEGVETMRISMGDARGEVRLAGRALAFGADKEDAPFSALGRDAVVVREVGGRLELDGAPVVGLEVRFRAGEYSHDAGVPGRETIRAAGLDVRGDVVVRLANHRLQLINVIPLEEYLAAVLGSEMPVSFPPEALKAQAVAARTYALQKKIEAFDQPYYLGASVLSQVYGGSSREDPRTLVAVEATRGEVLTFDLAPIEAYFHASCGGRTESGVEALGRDLPYLKPVDCPCGRLPASRWKAEIPNADLEQLFGADAKDVRVTSRTSTGRARRVEVGRRAVDAVKFREKLGYTRVKSLSFELESSARGLSLAGRGVRPRRRALPVGREGLRGPGLGLPADPLALLPGHRAAEDVLAPSHRMDLKDFDFPLPEAQIAQAPLENRDASRLLALDRRSGARRHLRFRELPSLLRAGDLLVRQRRAGDPGAAASATRRRPAGGSSCSCSGPRISAPRRRRSPSGPTRSSGSASARRARGSRPARRSSSRTASARR